MKTIHVQLRKCKGGEWKAKCRETLTGGMVTKKTAISAYKYVENRLSKLFLSPSLDVQTSVTVVYGVGRLNATNLTSKVSETLYALSCFMEDYLPAEFLAGRLQKYLKEIQK